MVKFAIETITKWIGHLMKMLIEMGEHNYKVETPAIKVWVHMNLAPWILYKPGMCFDLKVLFTNRYLN